MDLATIQSGRGGVLGAVARAGLGLLSVPYGFVARRRIAAYDGRREPGHLPLPVACIGNLTAGGTGKTPFVAWLARIALERGRHPAVLSRGYGGPSANDTPLSDEGCVLRDLLGDGVPLVEDPDRVRGGRSLVASHPEVDLLLLDDGFQHRRLHRDVDVVLLDATNPFGYDRLLPRGLLREPIEGLARADAVVVTRAERVTQAELERLDARIARLAPRARRASVRTRARALVRVADGTEIRLSALNDAAVVAWAGIGNPRAFVAGLEDLGAHVVATRFERDHYAFQPTDVGEMLHTAKAAGAALVVVTRKDLVKLRRVPGLPETIVALDIELEPGPGALDVAGLVLSAAAAGLRV